MIYKISINAAEANAYDVSFKLGGLKFIYF